MGASTSLARFNDFAVKCANEAWGRAEDEAHAFDAATLSYRSIDVAAREIIEHAVTYYHEQLSKCYDEPTLSDVDRPILDTYIMLFQNTVTLDSAREDALPTHIQLILREKI